MPYKSESVRTLPETLQDDNDCPRKACWLQAQVPIWSI